jgi:hypothetical protein
MGAYLATAYHHTLERYGAETQEFKITDNIACYCLWMNNELKLLPDTMTKVGDYRVAMCSKAIFHLLERQGCEHFKNFWRSRCWVPFFEGHASPKQNYRLDYQDSSS